MAIFGQLLVIIGLLYVLTFRLTDREDQTITIQSWKLESKLYPVAGAFRVSPSETDRAVVDLVSGGAVSPRHEVQGEGVGLG